MKEGKISLLSIPPIPLKTNRVISTLFLYDMILQHLKHYSDWDVNHCQTVRLVGRNCDDSNVDATFWNEAQAAWNSEVFNEYEYYFSVDSKLVIVTFIQTNFQSND